MTNLGLNVLQGSSPDAAEAWIQATRARYNVVINEPKTAARLQRVSQVIYRIHSAADNDDQALAYAPEAFVDRRHAEAPPGAWLALTNEPGRGNLKALNDWTVRAIRRCEQVGRKAVILNLQVGNPEPGDWAALRECCQLAKRGGHYLGLHEYWYREHTDTYLIGRYRMAQRELGPDCPPIVITELGYAHAGDPHKGYAGRISPALYGAILVNIGRGYRQDGILGACVFSYGDMEPWEGFNVADQWAIRDLLSIFNASTPSVPAPPPVRPPVTPPTSVPLRGGVVRSTVASFANVRAWPNDKSDDLGDVTAGERVQYRPAVNGWYYVEKANGVKGWVAAWVCVIQDAPAEAPAVRLDVPFRSQQGAGASAYRNDCGPACALMLMAYAMRRAGLLEPSAISVDDVARDTALASNGDSPLQLAEVSRVLTAYGIPNEVTRPLDLPRIRTLLDARKPPIVLVQYRHLAEGNPAFGHYAVVVAYAAGGFWLHDPYTGGAELYVTNDRLNAALTDMAGIAAYPYQGIILK